MRYSLHDQRDLIAGREQRGANTARQRDRQRGTDSTGQQKWTARKRTGGVGSKEWAKSGQKVDRKWTGQQEQTPESGGRRQGSTEGIDTLTSHEHDSQRWDLHFFLAA